MIRGNIVHFLPIPYMTYTSRSFFRTAHIDHRIKVDPLFNTVNITVLSKRKCHPCGNAVDSTMPRSRKIIHIILTERFITSKNVPEHVGTIRFYIYKPAWANLQWPREFQKRFFRVNRFLQMFCNH